MKNRLTVPATTSKYSYSPKKIAVVGEIIDNYGKLEDLFEKYSFENVEQLEIFFNNFFHNFFHIG